MGLTSGVRVNKPPLGTPQAFGTPDDVAPMSSSGHLSVSQQKKNDSMYLRRAVRLPFIAINKEAFKLH